MKHSPGKFRGQASLEYLLILTACVLAVTTGLAALGGGLDAWWLELTSVFSKPGP